jgi:hypothetical protein
MAFTFDNALDDDLVTVVDRNDDMGSYAAKIGKLETTVFIELGRFMTSETTKFQVSHAIQTPENAAAPYRTSLPFDDTPPGALHRAISGLTDYYRLAVKNGHKPNEKWLVKD